ncbi:MAG TPA: hypothetical protein VGQ84_07870 [Gaiellaceae bacterium]|nr:hypothetical protein [Gaiellaceae bacterium]
MPTATQLVALVASRNAIARSRLLILDVDGVVRAQTLEEILAGAQPGPREVGRYARPGLAVDAEHAFVVSAGGLVAKVDLGTLAVTYQRPARRTLSAPAKASEGSSLKALWLGNGLLAFSGKDEEVWTTADGVLNLRDRPAGLSVVDTRSWSIRTIDREAEWFVRAGRLLYAMRHSWDSSTRTTTGMGVAAYDFDGGKRFHVLPHAVAYLALVYRGRAYVGPDRPGGPYLVVDVGSGRVLGTRAAGLPRLLREQASPFWGNGY